MVKFLWIIFALFLFYGCGEKKTEIKIAANEWIGYAPLFYANEKGWLENNNIKLIRTVSLGESLKLYKSGYVNSFASTQYEYQSVKQNVYPVILLDESYGADVILATKPLKEILKQKKIDVYLEIDSVNYLLFKYFIKKYKLDIKKFDLHNFDQNEIAQKVNKGKNIMVVTYSPYDLLFLKKGFIKIASSKEKGLLIIDAIFADKDLSKQRFVKLKSFIDRALYKLKQNPKEFFKVVKLYYPSYDYIEFKKALNGLKWINKPNKEILDILKSKNIEIKSILP